MITVKFPSLEKALKKDLKDLPETDPRRGIIVLSNNAIVIQDRFCFVCDLYDYFTLEAGIEDDFELEELDRILNFMDNKVFSKEFWSELTKGANMKIKNGGLFVENPKYSKDLHYKELEYALLEPLNNLSKLSKQECLPVESIAIPFGVLNQIYSCLSADFKNDIIIFEFNAQDRPVRFTFRARKHFYGYVLPNYDAAQEGFKFETLNQFVNEMEDFIEVLKAEEKSKLTPPPPPIVGAMIDEANKEEEESKGPSLFEDNE